MDTLFVMDEPSVGLHPRDIDRLVAILRSLVDAGNTVVVVEHDESMIRAADHVIEIGPEPGARGLEADGKVRPPWPEDDVAHVVAGAPGLDRGRRPGRG